MPTTSVTAAARELKQNPHVKRVVYVPFANLLTIWVDNTLTMPYDFMTRVGELIHETGAEIIIVNQELTDEKVPASE